MTFQALDLKGKQFLDLLDNNNNIIKLSYVKEDSCQDRRLWTSFIFIFSLLFDFSFLLFSISYF